MNLRNLARPRTLLTRIGNFSNLANSSVLVFGRVISTKCFYVTIQFKSVVKESITN